MNGMDSISILVNQRITQMNQMALVNAMNRLGSGQRIMGGVDGPAALITGLSMDSELAGLESEVYANARAMNVANTAGAALGQISNLLNDAKSLVAANANEAGLSDAEKQANQDQLDSILGTINRLANSTNFAGQKLLDGNGSIRASGDSLSLDSAGTSDIGQVEIDAENYTLTDLESGRALDTIGSNAADAMSVLDIAIDDIATQQARIGAFSSDTLAANFGRILSKRKHLLGSLSSIRDTDYALETSAKIRAELLGQSSLLLTSRMGKQQHLQSMLLSVLG